MTIYIENPCIILSTKPEECMPSSSPLGSCRQLAPAGCSFVSKPSKGGRLLTFSCHICCPLLPPSLFKLASSWLNGPRASHGDGAQEEVELSCCPRLGFALALRHGRLACCVCVRSCFPRRSRLGLNFSAYIHIYTITPVLEDSCGKLARAPTPHTY